MTIDAKDLKFYLKFSLPELLDIAERHVNKYIRERDRDGDYFFCPTHNNGKGKIVKIEGAIYQACHVYPAGQYPWIRFNPDNIHGGCKSCNFYKHGVGHEYVEWARKKIGDERFEKLKLLNDYHKQHGFKWDRISVIQTIVEFKNKKP